MKTRAELRLAIKRATAELKIQENRLENGKVNYLPKSLEYLRIAEDALNVVTPEIFYFKQDYSSVLLDRNRAAVYAYHLLLSQHVAEKAGFPYLGDSRTEYCSNVEASEEYQETWISRHFASREVYLTYAQQEAYEKQTRRCLNEREANDGFLKS